jgi:hypothetical protein
LREHLAHVTNAVTGYIFTTVRGSFASMTRLAHVVIPGLPHDVTQRRNRREAIFFKDGDQELLPAAGPALRSPLLLLVPLIPRIHSEERLLRGHFGAE